MPLLAGALAVGGDFQNLETKAHSPLDSGTTTSATFTTTRSGATSPVGRSFTAPPSGKVMVHWGCSINTASAAVAGIVSYQVRTGSVLGSGTVIQAAADANSTQHLGTGAETAGRGQLVEGLTAGSDYNVTQVFRVTTGGTTGTFSRNDITIVPCIA